jgi:phage terminase large subunit
LSRQVYGACNPGPPTHHLARRFGLGGDAVTPMPGSRAVRTQSTDNFFLPRDYLAQLATYTGLALKRFVLGLWVGGEGLVYDRWNRDQFVTTRPGPWSRVIVGQDEGYTNPAVILMVGEDNDGRLHVIDEWYERKTLEADVIAKAAQVNAAHKPEAFVVDPAAAKLRAAMVNAGLRVYPANNDVFPGIQRVQQRLIIAGDDRPRLTVDPRCVNLIREFETYEWKTDRTGQRAKDEPKKEHDHALDALRYVVAYVDGLNFPPRWADNVASAAMTYDDRD